jgi:hypothetical protein
MCLSLGGTDGELALDWFISITLFSVDSNPLVGRTSAAALDGA